MDRLRLDLTLAMRALRANPGYALAAILTLAIGIGANAAVFNLANWLLLRPVPGVQDPDRLVALSLMPTDRSGAGLISNPELEALRNGVTGLSGIAGYHEIQFNVATEGATPRRVHGVVVSDNYFDVLGGPISQGRGFTREEGLHAGAAPTVVVSHDFWVSALGRASDVLGRTVTINGGPFTIVGVATPGFRGTSRAGRSEVWVPAAQHRYVLPMYRGDVLTSSRAAIFFSLVGRLRPGTTLAQAEAEGSAVRAASAASLGVRQLTWVLVAREGMEPTPWMRDRVNRLLAALVGGVVLLLMLTCANVGNLILARASGRRAEIATRLALGASRFSVARLLLVESVVLSAIAGGVAMFLTWALARWLDGAALLPGVVTLGRVGVEWPVFAFAFGVSVAVAVVAGIAPALTAARVPPDLRLRGGQAGGGRVRQVFIVAQVAVSVTLLVGAVLLVRSVNARFAIPIGFDPARVLSVSLEPALQRYTPERTDGFYRELLDRVRLIPGVGDTGLAWIAPFSRTAADSSFWPEGESPDRAVSAHLNMVSPGYLAALGVPLLEGRDFTDEEFMRRGTATEGAVIITASLARRLFGEAPGAGRRITMRFPEGAVRTVVGVIADQRQHRLMDPTADLLLEPFGQPFTSGFASLQVAMHAPADQVLESLAAAVRDLDPTLPLYDAQTLQTALRQSMGEEVLVSQSVTAFAVLAMLVAAVGLAAVLARAVTERRREFGVRAACGATPARLAVQITGEAFRLGVIGIAAGLGLSVWFGRLISARLYGVTAQDPLSLMLVAGGVLAVTLLAAALPARRAARADPASALR